MIPDSLDPPRNKVSIPPERGIDPDTLRAARKRLVDKGITVQAFSARHKFCPRLVYKVLSGQRRCLRGQSHQIAVALGIKDGGDA